MALNTAWKGDNYKFVGKTFDFAYADRLNKLLPVVGEVSTNSIDYELTGTGGYGEMAKYDGTNLVMRAAKRGFKTIVTPEEYNLSDQIGYAAAKVDKSGEARKIGMRLGNAASMTVYLHALRLFAHAFDGAYAGGDGKAFAATDHPVASLGSTGRVYNADPDAGTYSNLVTDTFTVSAITKAQAATQEGVYYEDYYAFYFATKDLKGDKDESGKTISGSEKEKKLAVIDGMNLTDEQKDVLYYAAGYAESTIEDAPWRGGGAEEDRSYWLPTSTKKDYWLPTK